MTPEELPASEALRVRLRDESDQRFDDCLPEWRRRIVGALTPATPRERQMDDLRRAIDHYAERVRAARLMLPGLVQDGRRLDAADIAAEVARLQGLLDLYDAEYRRTALAEAEAAIARARDCPIGGNR